MGIRLRALGADRRQLGAISAGTAVVVAAVSAVVATGASYPANVVKLFNGTAWLANAGNHTVSHVNGYSGRVDKQLRATNGDGFTVVQRSDGAYVVDTATGAAARIDGAQLSMSRPRDGIGSGIAVLTGGGRTYEVDEGAGLVQPVDPTTLAPIGHQLSVGSGVGPGVVGSDGSLWLPVPGSGRVVQVPATPAPRLQRRSIGSAGTTPALATVRSDAVAVDVAGGTVVPLGGGSRVRVPALRPLAGKPVVVVGAVASDALVVVGSRSSVAVHLDSSRSDSIPLTAGVHVSRAAIAGDRAYLLDDSAHHVDVLDLSDGRQLGSIAPPGGADDLVGKDDLVYVNDTGGPDALVVDSTGRVTPITKYTQASTDKALGRTPKPPPPPAAPPAPTGHSRHHGSAPPSAANRPGSPGGHRGHTGPPAPAPTPTPTPTASKPPEPSAPSAPAQVSLTAGDATIDAAWTAADGNGSRILDYTVSDSEGHSVTVAGDTTKATLSGLPNGQQDCVTVQARNAVGAGPLSRQVCATPAQDVPGQPGSVTATAGNASATVNWTAAADGPRSPVADYLVVANPGGAQQTVPAGTTTVGFTGLTNGTSYTFDVTARNAAGAGGAPATSNAVVPSGPPGAVTNLNAVGGTRSVRVSFGAPADNGGSAVTGYVITVNGSVAQQPSSPGTYTISGLADDTSYTIGVHAVNANGPGPDQTASARTTKPAPQPSRVQIYRCASSTNYFYTQSTSCDGVSGYGSPTRAWQLNKVQLPGTVALYRAHRTTADEWELITGAQISSREGGNPGWVNTIIGYVGTGASSPAGPGWTHIEEWTRHRSSNNDTVFVYYPVGTQPGGSGWISGQFGAAVRFWA